MTRRPNGPYLIESSPDYRKRLICLALHRWALLPLTILCAAVAGAHSEHRHMRNAPAVPLDFAK